MDWLHASELHGREESGAKLYGVSAIPAYALIDSNGILIALDLPGSIKQSIEGSLHGDALKNKLEDFLIK